MDRDINLKIKLSRIYRIKKDLISELNRLRSDLSEIVKNLHITESVPESAEFASVFRDFEYSRLSKLITEYVNTLEKPQSGEPEEIFEKEVENIKTVINGLSVELSKTVKRINQYIHKISGDGEELSLEKFIYRLRSSLEKSIDRELKKEIKPDLDKLKEKLHYLYRYEDYGSIMNFLKTYEREVNIYLSQKGTEKLEKIFRKYKEEFIKELSRYLSSYIKSQQSRQKIIQEVVEIFEDINIKSLHVVYTLPDVNKYFAGLAQNTGKLDIIVGNIGSPRFIGIALAGVIIFLSGFFVPLPEGVKEITVLSGLAVTIYAFFDSAFFNRYYMKKYIKEIRESIKEELLDSTDSILSKMKEKILRLSMKAESVIIASIKRETKAVRDFENFLINLRNAIERYIFKLSNIRKELELELSEED
jgi:DNA-binding ferritin-like protein (Dps family)